MIEIKFEFPYVYLKSDSNLVFVYRLKAETYVTVPELIDGSGWSVYELNPLEQLEAFDPKGRQPVQGKGFFLNHEDLAEVASHINRKIQRRRSFEETPRRCGEVHIVTSESAAGSLRAGMRGPKTVIGFPDSFSIGPLWKLAESTGQNFRRDWLFDHINMEQEAVEYEIKFGNTLQEIEEIPPDVPVHLWIGENAEEQTGLRFYLYLLREKTNPIFLINTCEEESAPFHTGYLDSEKMTGLFQSKQGAEPLTEEKRKVYSQEWIRLSHTEEVLRVWKNGEIQHVTEDYYDSLILETLEKLHNDQISKDYVLTAQVIGEIVATMEEFIDYYYLEYRIRHLAFNRTIDFKGIPKSMRHYRIKLP